MFTPRFRRCVALVLLCTAAIVGRVAAAESLPFVSPVFGDGMVLQRDKPNTIWGWSQAGDVVEVRINERRAKGTADSTGRWQVRIEPPPVGTACVIRVDGAQHAEFRDVVVGDVWLCGGQSNMQFGLSGAINGAAEVAAANHPSIRFFTVQTRPAYEPAAVASGSWKRCTSETVAQGSGISAVAYFFARRVLAETGVPIGLVQASVGGTPAECWMSPAAVEATGEFRTEMAEIGRLRQQHARPYGNYIMHWYDRYDAGLQGQAWSAPDVNDRTWKTVRLASAFKDLGLEGGPAVCWLRRHITLPEALPPGNATLRLGVVEKMDTAWINGRFVGASSWVENPRAYQVPAGVLKAGTNTIVVRVFKLASKTGFLTPSDELTLSWPDGTRIPLEGDWSAAVGVDARPPHPLPLGYENYPIMPSVLYEGMLRPLVPLAIRGALWYQGEANTTRARQYRTLLPALIADWRSAFGQGDFPFLIVSLPAFQARRSTPGSDGWAELREAQALTAATVPNCGLAVTIDTGEADNIHPAEKQPVGERLARIALAKVYGKDVPYRGPTFRRMEKLNGAIRVHFDHVDGGLTVRGAAPAEFSVAGADGKWHWAEAKLDGDTIVVSSPAVAEPKAVRYAWQANPQATLFNGAGLPAVPFRAGGE